jgi:hypothetical protein
MIKKEKIGDRSGVSYRKAIDFMRTTLAAGKVWVGLGKVPSFQIWKEWLRPLFSENSVFIRRMARSQIHGYSLQT